jgi:Rieske 2Fe-2S family protein
MHTIAKLIADQKPNYSLQQRFYTDSDVYDLEIERIVNRNWILAGHVSQWLDAGDFRVLNVGRESAIIVRGTDAELRGFANVCRHRGSLVCLEASGHAQKFVCPYHGWTYDINGKLVAARDMPDSFEKNAHGLNSISVDVIHGLVFVCFSDSPPSLQDCKHDFAAPMAMFDFPGMKVAAQRSYPIAANWKLAIENYQECYHCATAHPEYAVMHTLMLDLEKRAAARVRLADRMPACGVQEFSIDKIDTAARAGQMGYGYSRNALFKKYQTGSEAGVPVAPLLGDFSAYDGGASDFSFGAFSFLLAYSDHVVAYVFTPVDHQNSSCEVYWLVRGDAVEGEDYDVQKLTWLWDITLQADQKIIENNWQGIRSKYYRPGPFSRMERAEGIYVEWLLAELQRPL